MDEALTSHHEYLATGKFRVTAGRLRSHLILDFVAGHYAGLDHTPRGRTRLVRSHDPQKDQTYYLSSVPEEQLAKAVFPLAGLRKTQVRELARRWDLPTASRAESMGICFVGERGKFGNFVCKSTAWRLERLRPGAG